MVGMLNLELECVFMFLVRVGTLTGVAGMLIGVFGLFPCKCWYLSLEDTLTC